MRDRLTRLGYVVVAGVAILTAASMLGRLPYFELATHFRLQYAVGASLAAALLATVRAWPGAALAVVCAAANWGHVVPYYVADPPAAHGGATIPVRLMLANLYYRNRDYGSFVDAVRRERPDAIVLQELTDKWWAGVSELRHEFPHHYAIPRKGGSGIGILSRYPLEHAELLGFDDSLQPGIVARLDVEGTPLTVLAIHPPTPLRAAKLAFRNKQLVESAARMRETEGAKVLIGDLNTSPWSPYFLDLVRESGLRDARAGSGVWPTWPAPLPPFMKIPIDHCLVGEGVRVDRIRAGEWLGSDHLPLVVDVAIAR